MSAITDIAPGDRNQSLEQNSSDLLIIGYGNPDREDDGVAWHVLNQLAGRLGRSHTEEIGDVIEDLDHNPGLLFDLQLMPELSETVSKYERVCFVDAHTGSVPKDLQFIPIEGEFQTSPLTHHMTPQTVLELANTLYGHKTQGYLLSIRGYQFGFSYDMSPATSALANQAVDILWEWIHSNPETTR
jgi:hydrogenase maturation protease